MIALLAACAAPADDRPADRQEISLLTRDGITLAADYYPSPEPEAPGVLLLHMVPPDWDRTSWPGDFITALRAQGLSVLAIDRRGAGDSEGEPEDAYEGEAGRYDVEAAMVKLSDDGAQSLAIIGASNGTTSLLDYCAWAGGEGLPEAAAVGLMTGGTYTENNTAFSALPSIPAVFTYSTAERDWSVAQQGSDPGSWMFLEYPEGDHGTKMFEAAPEVADDLTAFMGDNLSLP